LHHGKFPTIYWVRTYITNAVVIDGETLKGWKETSCKLNGQLTNPPTLLTFELDNYNLIIVCSDMQAYHAASGQLPIKDNNNN
jgi:hypothetical protein